MRRWLFAFFLVSGFCSLVLEVVWLRVAMAHFGVTNAVVSIVLSTFMAGLAVGSWGAGRLTAALERRPPAVMLRLYAAAEALIALGATAVPALFAAGRHQLLATSEGWDSTAYHVGSGVFVALALFPFSAAMGATFPLALSFLQRATAPDRARSFSYLYLANVVGAMTGTLVSAFVLIELLGFHGTLSLVAFFNASLAALALALSLRVTETAAPASAAAAPAPAPATPARRWALVTLFLTGLVSMGMEVAWVREFTAYLGNVVYTFAIILAAYLGGTLLGSALYRARSRGADEPTEPSLSPTMWAVLALTSVLPLVAADPRLPVTGGFTVHVLRALVGTIPFCTALGIATPLLMDRCFRGDPRAAGTGYAVNIVGCILGPLLAGFGLLPFLGERGTIAVLAALLVVVGAFATRRHLGTFAAALAGVAVVAFTAVGYESLIPGAVVRRDNTATVVATGKGLDRRLLVNGIGMTSLTPITKMMAHFPMSYRPERPRAVLVICFGMGTSFRSSLSWDVRTIAVELIPSVPDLFSFFHADAADVLRSPLGQIVVDDGRRFLERTAEEYDVVVIDPPPPIEAAGSSLLYSREFYEKVRLRLRGAGILQQWIPDGEPVVVAAAIKALTQSFPYVRGFSSVEGWGVHLLASREPLPDVTALTLAARMPERATRDMLEWGPFPTAPAQFGAMLDHELTLSSLVPAGLPGLTDDHPVNEYYFLRRLRQRR